MIYTIGKFEHIIIHWSRYKCNLQIFIDTANLRYYANAGNAIGEHNANITSGRVRIPILCNECIIKHCIIN